jgi:hypothetical protein
MQPKSEKNWEQQKKVILLLLLFTTFGGALRKWVFSSGAISAGILMIQLLLPFLFIFLPSSEKLGRLKKILMIYALSLVALAINPMNQTYFHGIFGFILHFGFWYVLFYYLRNREYIKLEEIVNVAIVVSFIEIGLAIMQYGLPMDHFLNRYVAEEAYIATVGEAVRVTGTFSYISGFSAFLIFHVFLTLALVYLKYPVKLTIPMIFLGILAALISGSRATVFIYSAFLIGGLLVKGQYLKHLVFKGIGLLLLLSFVVTIFGSSFGVVDILEKSLDNFSDRVEKAQHDQNKRIYGPLTEIIHFRGKYPLFGIGLGATYQGATALWGQSVYAKQYGGYEEEPERVILEGGYFLFLMRGILWGIFIFYSKINRFFLVIIALILNFYTQIHFSTYHTAYILLGLMLLDRVFLITSKRKKDEANRFATR